MNDRVRKHFDATAEAFDAIYTARKGKIGALLDRIFRRDMAQRLDETLRECGEVSGVPVLDVGCGGGRYAAALARRGARVTGVDSAGRMISIARKLAEEQGLSGSCSFVEGDILGLDLKEPFRIALAIGFFDYTPDPEKYLRKIGGLTEEKLIATFPRLLTWRAPLRLVRLALRGCPVYFYGRGRVERLMRKSGWRIVRVKRLGKLHFVVARPAASGPS